MTDVSVFLDSGATSGTAPHDHRRLTELAGEPSQMAARRNNNVNLPANGNVRAHVLSTIRMASGRKIKFKL